MDSAERARLNPLWDSVDRSENGHRNLLQKAVGLASENAGRSFFHEPTRANVFVAPLFYEQPLVSVCAGCEVWKSSEAFRWMAERGLVVPVAYADYDLYSRSQLALFAAVKHVSRDATRLVMDHHRDFNQELCMCGRCMLSDIRGVDRLSPQLRGAVADSIDNLQGLPAEVQNSYIREISVAALRRSRPALDKLDGETTAMRTLYEAQAFEAVPQLFAANLAKASDVDPGFMAESLQVAYNPAIEPIEYLQVISEHRGSLSPLLTKGNLQGAINQAQKINEEVIYISGQRKSQIFRVSTSIARTTLASTAEAVLGGIVGFAAGGIIGAAAGSAATPCLHQGVRAGAKWIVGKASKSAKLAATVFGTTPTAVQVWQIRRDLGQAI